MQETWVPSLDREDPLEKGMPAPVFLAGESHGHLLLVSLFCTIDLCPFCTIVYSLANITLPDYCDFIIVLRSGSMSAPDFLFFSNVLAILYILLLYTNFSISL